MIVYYWAMANSSALLTSPAQGESNRRVIVRSLEAATDDSSTEPGREFRVQAPSDEVLGHWREVMKSKAPWESDKRAADAERKKARQTLQNMFDGSYADLSSSIKKAIYVEVVLNLQKDWAWTVPWEFLLTSVFESQEQAPIIVRTFDQEGPPAGKQWVSGRNKLLTVLSNAGPLKKRYPDASLTSEERVVSGNLALKEHASLPNATLEAVRGKIDEHPWAIHLVCIDVRRASLFLKPSDWSGPLLGEDEEGIVLGDASPRQIAAKEFADAVCSNAQIPALLGCNLYYSNLMAAWSVADGVATAIGIDGYIDDVSAENFFADFYLAMHLYSTERLDGYEVLDSFRLAFDKHVRGSTELSSSIVLYNRTSLLKPMGKFVRVSVVSPRSLLDSFNAQRDAVAEPGEGAVDIVWMKPKSELNYSMLHNGERIFEYFMLAKTPPMKTLKNVRVQVALCAGAESASFERSKDMPYSYWPLENEVRIPLVSGLLRSSRSTVGTNLTVRVTYDGRELIETVPVRILPIDQWQDDDLNRQWLPSFVFPGDRAVRKVIDQSQRYLVALSDNVASGFGGYQDSDEVLGPDGGRSSPVVDNQVRAMWWALINELPLSYVNPPPTYSQLAQRIRTPSDVLESKRGTCLDLALFFAACLEYIDLRPVIFLLYGHAFPGYFRSERAYDQLREKLATATEDRAIWMFRGSESYRLILDLVGNGDLVPIETLVLNERGGFVDAVEQGSINLRAPGAFQSLVDIKTARDKGVTPLPIEEAR
ncbi:MAG TPA: hypothetical protein VKX49_23175 [Bryobacteraceae bacterium]|nr:hypothetical protein [Bryobacteraceae bacterium]